MKFPIHVFVYGTLKKGEGNHRVMEAAKGKFMECASIEAKLFNLGYYPAVAINRTGETQGEVYQVDTEEGLRILDNLEGYPHYYNRSKVRTLHCSPGYGREVWVYHMDGEHLEAIGAEEIESGEWKNITKRNRMYLTRDKE
jgi:gamma-glutamylcyclotransferase (GGCT)/AIG2-like uncharacterized protein YtfP